MSRCLWVYSACLVSVVVGTGACGVLDKGGAGGSGGSAGQKLSKEDRQKLKQELKAELSKELEAGPNKELKAKPPKDVKAELKKTLKAELKKELKAELLKELSDKLVQQVLKKSSKLEQAKGHADKMYGLVDRIIGALEKSPTDAVKGCTEAERLVRASFYREVLPGMRLLGRLRGELYPEDGKALRQHMWRQQHTITTRAKALFAKHPEIQKEIRCKQAFFKVNDMMPLAQTLGNTIRWRKHRWPPSYK